MNGKTFIDTNVLIYAHDTDAGAKREIAKTVLRDLWSERTGVLSVQVLQEFYVNVTRKIPSPLSRDLARLVVSSMQPGARKPLQLRLSRRFGSRTNRESVSGMP
jgi:predicted nucleic acid-binding protein